MTSYVSVDGTSDDLDRPILKCFLDEKFVERYGLISINSINWARIMVQIAHYFYGYFKVRKERPIFENLFFSDHFRPTSDCFELRPNLIKRTHMARLVALSYGSDSQAL